MASPLIVRILAGISLGDYLAALMGGISIAALARFALNLEFGDWVSLLIDVYDEFVKLLVDPVAEAAVEMARLLSLKWEFVEDISELWRHAAVLLGLYVQRHARNEWAEGHRATAAFQVSCGLAVIAMVALGGSQSRTGDLKSSLFDLYLFVGATFMYDAAFIIWAALFLRIDYAKRFARSPQPVVAYIVERCAAAFVRNATILSLASVVYITFLGLSGAKAVALSFSASVMLVGLYWVRTGFERARRESREVGAGGTAVVDAYMSYPAGKLGNAIVLAFIVSAALSLTGLAETWLGRLIELLL